MRFSKHHLLALILGAGMATALPAQAARRGAGRQGMDSLRAQRGAGRPLMDSARVAGAMARRAQGGGSPAAMILSQREKLGLTDDQVNRLETLKSSFAATEPAPATLITLRQELAEASKGEANIAAARAAMNKINEANANAMIARLEARNQARAVLNADQQAQFDATESNRPMAGLMGGMGGPGGPGAPGGRGGRGQGRGGPPPVPPAE